MDESSRSPSGPAIEPLAVAVVEAVAERAGVDATDLDRPLYDVIDPDALEALFPRDASGRPECRGHVSFPYGDLLVEVTSDREVRVVETAEADRRAGGRGTD